MPTWTGFQDNLEQVLKDLKREQMLAVIMKRLEFLIITFKIW